MALQDKIETFMITTAQGRASVNKQLYESMKTYLGVNDAKLLVLPMHGRHIDHTELSRTLDGETIIEGDYKLNSKLKIKDWKVKPQAIRPLTGLEPLVKGDKSAIIPGTKINLRAVPNSNTRIAKLLMTTGALTHPNYNMRHRTGRLATSDHEYGAVIVEIVNDKKYHVRHINALRNGKFTDLGTLYDGENVTQQRPTAIVFGDVHATDVDPQALKASLAMVRDMKPYNLFLHDLFDGNSISHHNINDLVEQHYFHGRHGLSLDEELKTTAKVLQEIAGSMPSDGKIYIVASNHNEVIDKYLRQGRFVKEPQNIEVACDLMKVILKGESPLKAGLERHLDLPDNIYFLRRGEDLRLQGYFMSEHGDQGPNGSRGSPHVYSNTLEKSVTGHTHSAFKHRHTNKTGTLSRMNLRYNMGGTSNWTHTNAILDQLSKVQLVHLIDGHYRAQKT